MASEEKVTSYILVGREGENVFYVAYGHSKITSDLKDARRYSRKVSAASALKRLAANSVVRPELLKVESIEE